jgi:AcrR family transcriptional regulator
MTHVHRPDQPHPVGRGPKVRRAVFAATIAELGEAGYAALTIEAVARRAGVHKTTVYRRWPDREALVLDALTGHAADEVPLPDTGSIETDLRELARSRVRAMLAPDEQPWMMAVFASDAARLPDITRIRRRYAEDRFWRASPVIARAIERGELPADTDPGQVLRTLIAPILLRLLITAEPVDEATADQAAQIALTAAKAGLLNRQHPVPADGSRPLTL